MAITITHNGIEFPVKTETVEGLIYLSYKAGKRWRMLDKHYPTLIAALRAANKEIKEKYGCKKIKIHKPRKEKSVPSASSADTRDGTTPDTTPTTDETLA